VCVDVCVYARDARVCACVRNARVALTHTVSCNVGISFFKLQEYRIPSTNYIILIKSICLSIDYYVCSYNQLNEKLINQYRTLIQSIVRSSSQSVRQSIRQSIRHAVSQAVNQAVNQAVS